MLTTSYFANLRNIENPVSISRYQPSWYDGPRMTLLAPSPSLLLSYKNQNLSESDYVETYKRETLSKLRQAEVHGYILSNYSDRATLVCYERPGEFCHRRIVAEWLAAGLGIVIPELIAKKSKPSSAISLNLFAPK